MASDEDLRNQALNGVIQWSLAVLIEVERMHSVQEELVAGRGVMAHYGREQRHPFVRLRIDRTFLFFAAANLIRAHAYLTDLTAPDAVPSPPGSVDERAKLLRDCAEHWDERYPERARSSQSGRAFRNFEERFPGEENTSHQWGPGGATVGGLDVPELTAWAQELYDITLKLDEQGFVHLGWMP